MDSSGGASTLATDRANLQLHAAFISNNNHQQSLKVAAPEMDEQSQLFVQSEQRIISSNEQHVANHHQHELSCRNNNSQMGSDYAQPIQRPIVAKQLISGDNYAAPNNLQYSPAVYYVGAKSGSGNDYSNSVESRLIEVSMNNTNNNNVEQLRYNSYKMQNYSNPTSTSANYDTRYKTSEQQIQESDLYNQQQVTTTMHHQQRTHEDAANNQRLISSNGGQPDAAPAAPTSTSSAGPTSTTSNASSITSAASSIGAVEELAALSAVNHQLTYNYDDQSAELCADSHWASAMGSGSNERSDGCSYSTLTAMVEISSSTNGNLLDGPDQYHHRMADHQHQQQQQYYGSYATDCANKSLSYANQHQQYSHHEHQQSHLGSYEQNNMTQQHHQHQHQISSHQSHLAHADYEHQQQCQTPQHQSCQQQQQLHQISANHHHAAVMNHQHHSPSFDFFAGANLSHANSQSCRTTPNQSAASSSSMTSSSSVMVGGHTMLDGANGLMASYEPLVQVAAVTSTQPSVQRGELASAPKSSQPSTKSRRGRPRKKGQRSKNKVNGKLWEFIRDLLLNERTNPSFIRWERREDGVFKFVQSDKVAKMWGERKQNPKMTYEKLSRAMRYYYKSKVLLPVFGRRLVYKFGPNATGWLPSNDELVF